VQAAADVVIQDKLKPAGGEGAVIALDPQGRFAMSYNSEGLYRGYITRDGKVAVHLYED
jgi:beta-aspartyl-peptidase (threonine type)